MNPAPQREEALFHAAAQLTGAARAAFLDSACHGAAALRRRLEVLLAAHEQSGDSLATDAPAARATMKLELSDAPDEAVGTTIGRYKLREKIGEGGWGVVYVAEQTEPVRRRVALKVIKLGMDTKQVVARFQAERQALAMMDHPNIARVLDAGTTEAGRPYFIMELVRGIRITDYCDQNNLSTKERLDLFIQVCHATQHAHQKGIIHRDIKPSNILVTMHDGVPVPKVIDFGIAKATEGRLTDATVYTQLHQFVGTPAYMSPEQAEMSGLDIDTRSDIYSLGVLLYELLTGKTPFDAKELMSLGIDAMRKTIREKEPVRPSTKVATLQGEELSTTATRHAAEAPRLISLLRGDLDWIVMKCLEKDRTRRYETANGLAMDLKRHLSNETVVARPPSSAYRFQKLVRRNKLAFAAAGVVACALVLGIVATTWQAIRATHAKQEALAAQASEKVQRQLAEANEQKAATSEQKAVAAEQEQARLRAAAEQEAARSKKLAQASLDVAYGDFSEADQILNAMPLQPEMAGLFAEMGRLYAYHGQWQLALTNYSKVAQIEPSDPPLWQLAVLDFQVGDMVGYNHWRDEILLKYGTTTNSLDASYYARVCLIAPPSPAESTTIGRMVDVGFTSHYYYPYTGHYEAGLSKEWWDYRQGHFANAREGEQKTVESPNASDWYWDSHAEKLMLVAMAENQLKQTNDARATFVKGLELADEKMITPGNNLNNDWDDWLMAHFLMREAAALMPEVLASNVVFAGIVDQKPSWQIALTQAGLKFDATLHFDGTWQVKLTNQPISDLSVLRGAPLSELQIEYTGVTNLAPLRGMPLKGLFLNGDNVSDLSPLQGMPLTDLRMGGCKKITDLGPLAGITTLQNLQLGGTQVTDLSPLRGMALTRLTITGTPVSDLSPLCGMPLTDLRMRGCKKITDLGPLAGITTLQSLELPPNATNIEIIRGLASLTRIGFKIDRTANLPDKTAAQFWADYDQKQSGSGPDWQAALTRAGLKFTSERRTDGTWEVNLNDQPISDLSLLRGAPVSRLELQHTEVSNLSPLRRMPLQWLALAGTQVTDLSPLRGMALTRLNLSGTPVSDLSPLQGMPLTDLRLATCAHLTNLQPLAGMITLQTLELPPNATNIEFLRGLTNITRIGFKYDPAVHGPDKTAAEFWAGYDKNRNENKAASSP